MRFLKLSFYFSVLFFIYPHSLLKAQERDLVIAASELRNQSLVLTGDDMNWALLTKMGEYNPEKNQFILSAKTTAQLRALKKQHQQILEIKEDFVGLIKNGAKVFASKELATFDESINQYNIAQKEGNYFKMMSFGLQVLDHFKLLKKATETNRKERVSAILADKTGDIFKRKGMLSTWLESNKGDLYEEADGVKTLKESYAKLDFTDGSFVMINPETIAIIRQSTLDKLANTTSTEIQINNGGLVATLSNKSKQESNFLIKAAETESVVKSSKFWANKNANDLVSYSNFDGEARIRANSQEVVLAKDEGTIIAKGKAPLKPVKLLQNPKLTWTTSDSVTFDPSVRFNWAAVPKADYYEIDIAPSPSFTYNIDTYTSKKTSILVSSITEGTHYVRLRAYDALGLRGIDSPQYRLLKNKDDQPPAIFFKNGNQPTYFTTENTFTFEGITEPGSLLSIQGESVTVNAGGEFSHSITLNKNEIDVLIKATDRSQNKNDVKKRIVKMVESQFFDLSWSVSVQGNTVKRADKITVSGKAYEPVLVEAKVGGKTYKVECGSSWDWALQLITESAQTIELRFIHKKTGEVLAEKVFEIK